jgi:hypothetical protein
MTISEIFIKINREKLAQFEALLAHAFDFVFNYTEDSQETRAMIRQIERQIMEQVKTPEGEQSGTV